MTRTEWKWTLAYCAVMGIPSVLLMTYPLVGWIVGVPAAVWFWRALPKANR
jgi:hypothetical protein